MLDCNFDIVNVVHSQYKNIMDEVRLFVDGLYDSCRLNHIYNLIKRSQTIRTYLKQSLIVNGILVIGYHAWMEYFIGNSLLIYVYYLLWMYPYALVRMMWNLEQYIILSNRLSHRRDIKFGQIVSLLIYDTLLMYSLYIITFALSLIPYIGCLLHYFYNSLLISFICYDYKWNNHRISIKRRIDFIENRWPYFLGYGTFITLIMMNLTYPYSAGVADMLMITMFINAHRTDLDNLGTSTIRYAYFNEASLMTKFTVDHLNKKLLNK